MGKHNVLGVLLASAVSCIAALLLTAMKSGGAESSRVQELVLVNSRGEIGARLAFDVSKGPVLSFLDPDSHEPRVDWPGEPLIFMRDPDADNKDSLLRVRLPIDGEPNAALVD